jgi:hypothetical protein
MTAHQTCSSEPASIENLPYIDGIVSCLIAELLSTNDMTASVMRYTPAFP